MKWRKASEGKFPIEKYIPVKEENGFIRMGNLFKDDDGTYSFSVDKTGAHDSFLIKNKHFDKLYWLDETESPTSGKGEDDKIYTQYLELTIEEMAAEIAKLKSGEQFSREDMKDFAESWYKHRTQRAIIRTEPNAITIQLDNYLTEVKQKK